MRKVINLLVSAICFTKTVASEQVPPFFGHYDKFTTQFDGVIFDETVTYLRMEPTSKAVLPLDATKIVGAPTDFTFKFWFKTQESTDGGDDVQQFFSFEGDSVQCFISKGLTITCDTTERRKLILSYADYIVGKWYFFELTVTKTGLASIKIYKDADVAASDSTTDFFIKQNSRSKWSVCFGLCNPDSKGSELGFTGGIREVIALEKIETDLLANMIRSYNAASLGYFRFAG